jgi:uncharacterized protein DUF6790
MYFFSVLLLSVLLPAGSAWAEHSYFHAAAPLGTLAVKWFVFWASGARLVIAGLRQQLRPKLTSEGIFGIASDDPLPFVRELGVANFANGLVALLSLWRPDFLLPAAIAAAVFYTLAGAWHVFHGHMTFNRVVALVSDLLLGAAFGWIAFVVIANGGVSLVPH